MRIRPFEHVGLKLLSLALAVLLWLVVAGEEAVERGLRVPLELQQIPDGVELLGEVPDTVDVRVRGSSGALSRVGAGGIVAGLDLGGGPPGERQGQRSPCEGGRGGPAQRRRARDGSPDGAGVRRGGRTHGPGERGDRHPRSGASTEDTALGYRDRGDRACTMMRRDTPGMPPAARTRRACSAPTEYGGRLEPIRSIRPRCGV